MIGGSDMQHAVITLGHWEHEKEEGVRGVEKWLQWIVKQRNAMSAAEVMNTGPQFRNKREQLLRSFRRGGAMK